jgi:hypothetical protein
MDFLAYINHISATRIGTAQVLTFALPIGTFGAVMIWGFFERPGGHRRGHRRRVRPSQPGQLSQPLPAARTAMAAGVPPTPEQQRKAVLQEEEVQDKIRERGE